MRFKTPETPRPHWEPPAERECENCGVKFKPEHIRQTTCDDDMGHCPEAPDWQTEPPHQDHDEGVLNLRFKPLTEEEVKHEKRESTITHYNDLDNRCTHVYHTIKHGNAIADVTYLPCRKSLYVDYLASHQEIKIGRNTVPDDHPKAAEINNPENSRSAAIVGKHVLKLAKHYGVELDAATCHPATKKALAKYKFHGLQKAQE